MIFLRPFIVVLFLAALSCLVALYLIPRTLLKSDLKVIFQDDVYVVDKFVYVVLTPTYILMH